MNENIIAIAITILLTGCADFSAQKARDARLKGEWKCVSAIVDGKELPPATVKELRLTLTETQYITYKGSETLFDSSYRVDRSKHPTQIFMLGNEGALTGKEAQGIYAIARDTLQICYAMPGDPAPTEFSSVPGSKAYFITWRRAP